jgi:hypothetical protein
MNMRNNALTLNIQSIEKRWQKLNRIALLNIFVVKQSFFYHKHKVKVTKPHICLIQKFGFLIYSIKNGSIKDYLVKGRKFTSFSALISTYRPGRNHPA